MLDQCCNPLADLLMELAEPRNGLGFRRMVFPPDSDHGCLSWCVTIPGLGDPLTLAVVPFETVNVLDENNNPGVREAFRIAGWM